MKTTLRIVLGLVIVVAIAVGVLLVRIDAVAQTAIHRGGTYALGVETTTESVDISLWGGTAAIDSLLVANPAGYASPHVMHARHLGLSIEPGSIRRDTVIIRQIVIDGLDLNIDKSEDKYNIEVLSDHLKRFGEDETAADEGEPAPPEEDAAKQYVVQKLIVRNVTASVDGPAGRITVTPPDIELDRVTKDNVPIDELIAQMFPAIMMSVVKSMPANLSALSGRLAGGLENAAGALGGPAKQLVEQSVNEAGKQLGNLGEGAGKGAAETMDRINNLLRGPQDADDAN